MALEKEKLQKIIVVTCTTVMVTSLYYHFVIKGLQWNAVAEMKVKIGDLQKRIGTAQANEKKLKAMSSSCQEDERFLASHDSKIVRGDRIAWFWREMGDFAEKEKVSRFAVSPDSASQNGLPDNAAFERAGAALNLSCGYHKLGQFVQNLENSFTTVQIQHLEILGGNGTGPEAHTVRVQFQLLAEREQKAKAKEQAPDTVVPKKG